MQPITTTCPRLKPMTWASRSRERTHMTHSSTKEGMKEGSCLIVPSNKLGYKRTRLFLASSWSFSSLYWLQLSSLPFTVSGRGEKRRKKEIWLHEVVLHTQMILLTMIGRMILTILIGLVVIALPLTNLKTPTSKNLKRLVAKSKILKSITIMNKKSNNHKSWFEP